MTEGPNGGRWSRRRRREWSPDRNKDFEFIALCVILAAFIFGLIHIAMYFSNPSVAVDQLSPSRTDQQPHAVADGWPSPEDRPLARGR